MTFNSLSPMLVTQHLQETIRFYTDALGFTCEVYSDDQGWASLRRGQVSIMLSLPNEHEHQPFNKPVFTGSLYINTDAVDELWEQVKDKARICYPVENFPYGMREFAIYDNNGYLLQFGQPAETNA